MPSQPENRVPGDGPHFVAPIFEPVEALSWGLSVLRNEPQRVGIPLVLASFAIVIAGTVVPGILRGVVRLITASNPESILAMLLGGVAHLIGAGITLLVAAVSCSAVYPFVLNVARGRPATFDWNQARRFFPRMLVAQFFIACAVGVGALFCALPGILVVVVTLMAQPLLVDLDMTVLAALRGSFEISKTQLVPLLVFSALSFIALLAGLLLCFAGAVLVSFPVVFLAQAYVYLRLQGETPVLA